MSWSKMRVSIAPVLVALGLVLTACGLRGGGDYPSADITFIVPFAPGGATDRVTRLLAELSEPALKRKIVIVNKAGASGTLGAADILQAKPDGYTIGYVTENILQFQPLISQVPFTGIDDYTGLIKLGSTSQLLVVKADAPWRTMQEFIAEAKRRPGELRAGVSGKLTPPDLSAQFFMQSAQINFTTVPFTGGGAEAIAAVLGGHVESGIESTSGTIAQIEAGQLRPLMVFQEGRSPLLPEVPSATELGYKGAPAPMQLVIGPKGMDKAVVDRLNATFTDAWKSPRFQAFLKENGYVAVDRPLGPAELQQEQAAVRSRFQDLVKALNIGAKQ